MRSAQAVSPQQVSPQGVLPHRGRSAEVPPWVVPPAPPSRPESGPRVIPAAPEPLWPSPAPCSSGAPAAHAPQPRLNPSTSIACPRRPPRPVCFVPAISSPTTATVRRLRRIRPASRCPDPAFCHYGPPPIGPKRRHPGGAGSGWLLQSFGRQHGSVPMFTMMCSTASANASAMSLSLASIRVAVPVPPARA